MKFAIASSIFALAAAQEWEVGTLPKYTSLLGVFTDNAPQVYGSVMDNSIGTGVIVSNDYAATGSFYGPNGAMNMGIAVSNDICAMVGAGGIFVGPTSTMKLAKVSNIRGMSQSVETFGEAGFAVTGEFMTANGVYYTTDAATWNYSDLGIDQELYPARYGAFPSSNTWYVSSGIWPMDAAKSKGALHLSARVSVHKDVKEGLPQFTPAKGKALRGAADATGWSGAISKTTDGGQTWSVSYVTDQFYFNQVHCADDNTCVAVGENDDTAYALMTTNGGESWETVLTGPAALSLVAARMLSPSEAWVAGGLQSRGGLQGYYYHTTDAGATWQLHTASGYAFDMSFAEGVGYSAFLTQSYSSVAVYNKPQ